MWLKAGSSFCLNALLDHQEFHQVPKRLATLNSVLEPIGVEDQLVFPRGDGPVCLFRFFLLL
jgi:hypothetical protein